MQKVFIICLLFIAVIISSSNNDSQSDKKNNNTQSDEQQKDKVQKNEKEKEKPLFTFVHMTDTHCITTKTNPIKSPEGKPKCILGIKIEHWKDLVNSFEIFEDTVKYLNKEIKPDFVIHTGDITDKGGLDDLKKSKKILDKLKCPYYACQGDHELKKTKDKGKKKEIYVYEKVFKKRYRSFNKKGWHFIMMGIYPTDKELKWLEKDLTKYKKKKVVFFTHRLVVADPITIFAFKQVKIPCLMPKAEKVEKLLKKHGNVIMVLSGHVHTNLFITKKDTNTVFMATDAIGERPHEFKVFKVYEERIEITLFTGYTAKKIKNSEWTTEDFKTLKLAKKQASKLKDKQKKIEAKYKDDPLYKKMVEAKKNYDDFMKNYSKLMKKLLAEYGGNWNEMTEEQKSAYKEKSAELQKKNRALYDLYNKAKKAFEASIKK